MSAHMDTRIVQSLVHAQLRLSLKAIQAAKDAAFADLPRNERERYLAWAERAVLAEEKTS